jgi:hypothetical protein
MLHHCRCHPCAVSARVWRVSGARTASGSGVEDGTSLRGIVDAWNKVFASYESVVSLLLANPVEVVALACEDPRWQAPLLQLLGPVNARGEPLTPSNLFESVKLLKTPSWRYRTEVQGLLETACLRVTKGAHRSLEAVSEPAGMGEAQLSPQDTVGRWRCGPHAHRSSTDPAECSQETDVALGRAGSRGGLRVWYSGCTSAMKLATRTSSGSPSLTTTVPLLCAPPMCVPPAENGEGFVLWKDFMPLLHPLLPQQTQASLAGCYAALARLLAAAVAWARNPSTLPILFSWCHGLGVELERVVRGAWRWWRALVGDGMKSFADIGLRGACVGVPPLRPPPPCPRCCLANNRA